MFDLQEFIGSCQQFVEAPDGAKRVLDLMRSVVGRFASVSPGSRRKEEHVMGVLHAIRQRSFRAYLASTGAVFCLAAGLLAAAPVDAGASELCAHMKKGSPSGPLFLRDVCKKGELEMGTFNGQKWTLGAPAAHFGVSADSGASALAVGDGETVQ
jgi:hypothetical protein